MEKVIKDGYVAVLYSPGFGAGWYTWNQGYPEMMFDPVIVQYVEREEWETLETYMTLRYPNVYTGGMKDLKVEWIPQGTMFRIAEYDGNESVETKDNVDWLIA